MWIRRRFAELAQLVAHSRRAGRSVAATLPRFARLVVAGRYSPTEVFMLGLLGDGGPIAERAFPSKEQMLRAQLRVNPRECFLYTEDKLVFFQRCVAHGLATPTVRAALCPAACAAGEVPVARDAARLQALLAPLAPTDLVGKPVDGVHGHGVQVLRFEQGMFAGPSGAPRDAAGLVAELARSAYRNWLFQDRLYPHPDLVALSGSRYLQTARVVSLLDRDGHVQVPVAWLRIIGGAGVFDNFNFGASGNLVGTLDLDHGRIEHTLGPGPPGRPIVEATHHPVTGVAFATFVVPFAAEIRDLVERAARAFAPLRTIGWDVAITADGPSLIEGNVTWDPLPTKHDLRAVAAAL